VIESKRYKKGILHSGKVKIVHEKEKLPNAKLLRPACDAKYVKK